MAETTDQIRQLADLFLTRNSTAVSATATPVHVPMRRQTVELILVGHLPVRAGLWLTQYADDVARDEGPAGLVRLDSEQLILEILRGTETAARASAAATLQEAVESAADQVGRWIIRPALGASMVDVIGAGADVITLLTGADEAAVHAACEIVGSLCSAAVEHDVPLPAVELAVLGADRAKADQAAATISERTMLQFGIHVPLRRCVRSMGALGSTLHFRFPSDHAPTLSGLVETVGAARRAASTRPMERSATTRRPGAAITIETPISEPSPAAVTMSQSSGSPFSPAMPMKGREPVPSSAPDVLPIAPAASAPAPQAAPARPRGLLTPVDGSGFTVPAELPPIPAVRRPAAPVAPAAPARSTTGEPARLRPKPVVHVEAKPAPAAVRNVRPVPQSRPLSSFIPGLALLPVRCKSAPDIEIAVDTAGTLHLIAWEDRLRAATVASRWVTENRDLVAMACAEHAVNASVEPLTHLFTGEPANVADLQGTALRLHVLAPVEVEGRTGWYAAALNR